MLYTIYQAEGQILGSFMLAVEQTKAYSTISMIGNIFSLILLYFFQYPNFIWAKGLGANGMGWSYVIGVIFSFTSLLCFITKKVNMNFLKLYAIPIISMIGCFIIAFIPYVLLGRCISGRRMIFVVLRILCGGFLYCGIIMLLIWRFPQILGINKVVLTQKLSFWRNKKNGMDKLH